MPHTKIPKIELGDDDTLRFTIAVFGFSTETAPNTLVEISGHATQANGAIATFYDVQELNPPEPDGSSLQEVTAVPSAEFTSEQVITAAGQTRAVKVWGTVLDPDPGEPPPGIKARWNARPET